MAWHNFSNLAPLSYKVPSKLNETASGISKVMTAEPVHSQILLLLLSVLSKYTSCLQADRQTHRHTE